MLALGDMSKKQDRCTHMHVWMCFLLSRAKDNAIEHWPHSLVGSHHEQKEEKGMGGKEEERS